MINNFSVKLKDFGEFIYSSIIIFCTSEEDPRILKSSHFLEYFDKGGNLIMAGDIDTSKAFRGMANQLGVDFDPVVLYSSLIKGNSTHRLHKSERYD